jgi:hypothetical protein
MTTNRDKLYKLAVVTMSGEVYYSESESLSMVHLWAREVFKTGYYMERETVSMIPVHRILYIQIVPVRGQGEEEDGLSERG